MLMCMFPNGVNCRKYEYAEPLPGWPGEGGSLMFLGRIDEPRKGMETLIDVFGAVGHQLTTRLYMDFLRMEGEVNFLGFMPDAERQEFRSNVKNLKTLKK